MATDPFVQSKAEEALKILDSPEHLSSVLIKEVLGGVPTPSWLQVLIWKEVHQQLTHESENQ